MLSSCFIFLHIFVCAYISYLHRIDMALVFYLAFIAHPHAACFYIAHASLLLVHCKFSCFPPTIFCMLFCFFNVLICSSNYLAILLTILFDLCKFLSSSIFFFTYFKVFWFCLFDVLCKCNLSRFYFTHCFNEFFLFFPFICCSFFFIMSIEGFYISCFWSFERYLSCNKYSSHSS